MVKRGHTQPSSSNSRIDSVEQSQETFPCMKCHRKFKTYRGLVQHLKYCKVLTQNIAQTQQDTNQQRNVPEDATSSQHHFADAPEKFYWSNVKGSEAVNDIEECYSRIVYWKRNLFMLPNGNAGKSYIRETTRLLNAWIENTPLRAIALEAIHIMPALLLQKPSQASKSKEHVEALNRRLTQWFKGDFMSLMDEAQTIQSRLPKVIKKQDIAVISRKFRNHMQKGDVHKAINVVTNNMTGGILPLNDETLEMLRQKHPEGSESYEDTLIQGPIKSVNAVVYDVIDEDMIMRAAKTTKGGSGPSGMDANGWIKIIASRVYGDTGTDLRKAIAKFARRLCHEEVNDNSLEAYLGCRLVPLDKNPGLRPIGVGEVLRRIIGKAVMYASKNDVIESCSKIQMCSGHESGCEAAIHAMKDAYSSEEAECVLLVDAANAFNSLNRSATLHNTKIICPILATYINNCYIKPARLFVIGGTELSSREGTTQGDPLGMAIYAIGLTPLLDRMKNIADIDMKLVAFADDLTAVGNFSTIRKWWDELIVEGPKFGYQPQPKKSWLIVKDKNIEGAKTHFKETNIQITCTGERHLGAVIGSETFRKEYVEDIVAKWVKEITLISEIAVIEPQAAYTCYVSGYQHRFTYYLRTIPEISSLLRPVESVIRHQLLPAITGGHIVNDVERELMSLPPRLGA